MQEMSFKILWPFEPMSEEQCGVEEHNMDIFTEISKI
jgi:hypothetical protein